MMEEIVGKKIVGLQVGGVGGIAFKTEDGLFAYEPVPNCCESLELTHISGIEFLIGHTVQSVEARGYKELAEGSDPDNDVFIDNAFFQIKTDKGMFDFEGRNSHNGYYGGFDYRPVGEGCFHPHEWYEVTEDF